MNKKIKIALIIGGSLALVGIGYLVWKKYFKKDSDMYTSQKGIILLGGLDNRANDKSIEEQVNLVREGSNYENILGFRYNDLNGTIKAIEENPTYSVILFSAGCRYSFDVAKKMKEFNNIKNLYLAEPYGVSTTHTNNAKKSVAIALRNRWRRLNVNSNLKDEIIPKNIKYRKIKIGKLIFSLLIKRLI
jgi:hypothetical protein